MASEDETRPSDSIPQAAATAAPLAEGALVAGRYRVVRELARGGMGAVYEAGDLELRSRVALKVIRGIADERARERFRREIYLARQVTHPNVCRLFDLGRHVTEDGSQLLFITMELLDGVTLSERIKKKGRLTPGEALLLLEQVAAAVDAAHTAGVIHRDLKPGNIMLVGADPPKAVVTDFGVAHGVEDPFVDVTHPGELVGSPIYMAPEQLSGRRLTAQTDVYALGLILYEALTGLRPFEGHTLHAAIKRLDARPKPPHRVVAGLSRAWSRAIMRCLEPDPKERFAHASDVVRAVKAPAVRRRSWLTAAAALVLAAAAATGTAVWLARDGGGSDVRSIAVLPFSDLSAAQDQEYFCDGLAETLEEMLARLPRLRVAPRASAFSFKGRKTDLATIGEKLHVDSLLVGSVRKEGDRLRVSARLVNVHDGFQTWGQTYDRNVKDVFSVQDEISEAVVAALRVKLAPERVAAARKHRTTNVEAYDQVLLARQYFNRLSGDGFVQSVAAYEEALKLAPTYASAWAGLASAAVMARDDVQTPAEASRLADRAQLAAERAVELDPELGEAFAARAFLRFSLLWDLQGARADMERALELDPHDAMTLRRYSQLLSAEGQIPESVRAATRAAELDPLSSAEWNNLGAALYSARRFADARVALRRALELNPTSEFSHMQLAITEVLDGHPALALELFRKAGKGFRNPGTAIAEHDLHHTAEEQESIREAIAEDALTGAYQIAQYYAWTGDRDQAFAWLDRAYAQRDGGYYGVAYDPLLEKLRGDVRYEQALKRLLKP